MAKTFTFRTPEEIMESADTERRVLARRMKDGTARWGRWFYVSDQDTGVLHYRDDDGSEPYEIDLATCDRGTEILDWILQIEGKNWASDADIGALIRAFSDILPIRDWVHDPTAKHDVAAIIMALLDMAE